MNLDRRTFFRWSGSTALALGLTGCNQVPSGFWLGLNPEKEDEGPFRAPASDEIDLVRHALNRLTFGVRPEDYARVSALALQPEEAVRAYLEEQLAPERIDDDGCERVVRRLECLDDPVGELFEYKEKVLLSEMVRGAVLRAVLSRRQLYEVMVQFWTDHFNIDPSKGDAKWLKAADDRLVIRQHALGRFPDLLRASALSPAMLWYLDGRVNRRQNQGDQPNENYARELLELHTLGVHGGYTQKDVMEVARCLTGWTVRTKGQFQLGKVEFNPSLHDDASKTVLGHPIPPGLGERDLDRVLQIAAFHPSTARHLATKLCRKFIADPPPEPAVLDTAQAFLKSGGDIRDTLRALVFTRQFQETRGNKFKRPFKFIVSALRATAARTDAGADLTDYLLRMGQAPFHYPTPDGYPEEALPWMGTLLWRWNFAVALSSNQIRGTRIEPSRLQSRLGGEAGSMAHLLGRNPRAEEQEAYRRSGAGLALLLASPAFQRA
jgi:uncharacterized protein (DUF1800 family)